MTGSEAIKEHSKSTGTCYVCGGAFMKRMMLRHLKKCLAEHLPPPAKAEPILHLRIEGRYAPQYWLHVELRAKEQFGALDDFLREIWLECCGHLSAFRVPGRTDIQITPTKTFFEWTVDGGISGDPFAEPDWGSFDPIDMLTGTRRKQATRGELSIGAVLAVVPKLIYEYDFGTTTELIVSKVDERMGKPQKAPVWLLARNDEPRYACDTCGRPATRVYSIGYEAWFGCKEHAPGEENEEDGQFVPMGNPPLTTVTPASEAVESDSGVIATIGAAVDDEEDDEEGDMDDEDWDDEALPIVNSPRTGECGYDGPADDMPHIEIPATASAALAARAAKPKHQRLRQVK